MQRRRFKQTLSFPDPLSQEAERLRAEADKLPPGETRDLLLRKARQADTATHVYTVAGTATTGGSGTIYINRAINTGFSFTYNGVSTLTVQEIP